MNRTLNLCTMISCVGMLLTAGTPEIAEASTAGQFASLRYLLVNPVGVYVYTDEANKPRPNAACDQDRYILKRGHVAYRDLYALLLTAEATSSRIKVWIDDTVCTDDSPTVHALQIESPAIAP